jgi:hypothetical protein
MPTLDWNIILTGLLYAALTGIFNLALGHKSQVEAWAMANPKLAALLKLTRALGFDPWNAFSGGLLLLKGKLPAAQQADSPIAKAEQKKADDKLRETALDNTVNFGPPLLVLLFVGLCLSQQACAAKQLPCDDAKLRAIDEAYLLEVGKHCLQYASAAECPELPALRAKHSQDLKASCP